MFAINFALYFFYVALLTMLTLGIACNLQANWIPGVVRDSYSYGKNSLGPINDRFVKSILIPKRFFMHFYAFASIYMLCVLAVMISVYVFKATVPAIVVRYLHSVSPHQDPLSSPDATTYLIATFLLFLQACRRLYENLFIHNYSEATINLFHYAVGYFHYWGCGTILLSYAPGFMYPNDGALTLSSLGAQQYFAIALFFVAFHEQYRAHTTLASYRKIGDAASANKYFLPQGRLFNYVSCPNFFAEIIIYISLYILLGLDHWPWAVVTAWVISNQTLAAAMSHHWYKQKFNEYPANRKRIVPFVY